MDDNAMDSLLSGDPTKLPQLLKRVVRLFISSTFTDMTLERNSLMERVYPRLKKYCRERHGLDFQVVDMRWGVRDEATDDHQTVNLCSREIDNCQRVSLGPNFIALIGDKYGFRPLLNRIKSTEYRLLRRCLIESDISTDFLDTWYKEDLNAMPAEYLLQPISSILKNFTNKNEPELQMVDQRIWQAIQERLHDLLLIGSSRLVKQGRMSERDQLLKYSISVTEREVLEGCLDISEPKSHCLVYVRSIVNLRDHLSRCLDDLRTLASSANTNNLNATTGNSTTSGVSGDAEPRRDSATARKASLKIGSDTINLTTSGAQTASERRIERTRRLIARYIDLSSKDGDWQVDEGAQAALKQLKEIKLTERLAVNRRNLTLYKVHWNEQDGISLKSEEHKNYLNDFTDHFYGNLTRMIRNAVKSERSKTNTTGLVGEVLQHSHYALQVGKSVHGRPNELDQIRGYILTGHYQQQHQQQHRFNQQRRDQVGVDLVLPMFVFGVSGSGKTSILARAASSAYGWLEQARKRRRSSAGLQVNDLPQVAQTSRRWDRKPCIIMRFCCTTPASSTMVGMLTSVCRQLQYNFYQFGPLNGIIDQQQQQHHGLKRAMNHLGQLPYEPIPEDFVRLVYTFRQLIDNCGHQLHRRRVFVIILDSIERLSSPAEGSVEAKYSWLTSIAHLPPNVRLVISCSSTCEGRAQLDFIHLKRHFLQAHHRALGRINPDWLQEGEQAQNDREIEHSSSGDSGSESLDFSGSSSSSSATIGEHLEEGRRSIANNDREPSKYGHLLRRLVLPAIRLKRGSRVDIHDTTAFRPSVKFAQEPDSRLSAAELWTSKKQDGGFTPGSSEGNLNQPTAFDDLNGRSSPSSSASYLGLLHIRPLGGNLAVSVLRRCLAESGRNLTPQQWTIVERSFSHCSRPIFVKLALGEVINWKSYSTQGDTRGLTFGSAWLTDMPAGAQQLESGQANSNCYNELLRIVEECEASRAQRGQEEAENKFKWQVLAMEQQWLNYLDYRARLDQQAAAAKSSELTDGGGNLIIRIGGGGNTITAADGSQTTKSNGSNATNTTGGGSSSSTSICHLSDTIEDAISQLFARIELQHGYLLTKHSLSYITAARNGICENELEDILSLDDVVLDDVFQYHLPPVRRIPPLLWTRIRNDLPDYLSERDADGIVITWHHSQFKTVTERRYLSDSKQLVYIHSLLADYFLGKWADKPKPFRCTKQQIQMAAEQLESAVQQSMRDSISQQRASGGVGGSTSLMNPIQGSGRLGSGSARAGASFSVRNRLRSSEQHDSRLQWMQAKAHRRVPHQPLFYGDLNSSVGDANTTSPSSAPLNLQLEQQQQPAGKEAGNPSQTSTSSSSASFAADSFAATSRRRVRYNLRKLTELPHHLLRSGRFSELTSCVLFNYKWLVASIDALGLQSLFGDFEEALECLHAKVAANNNANSPTSGEDTATNWQQQQHHLLEQQLNDCVPSDELDEQTIRSMIEQINLLASTLRLSSSIIHSSPHMLAPQLVGRLVAVVNQIREKQQLPMNSNKPTSVNAHVVSQQQAEVAASTFKQPLALIGQLIRQCDRDGAADCALLPTDHCLQSPDGLQLSSLDGHSFGVMSMVLASDQRHLLAVSTSFIMWNISTGEIAREIDPKLGGALMREVKIGANNQLAIAYTSDNLILVLDILTQQILRSDRLVTSRQTLQKPISGLKLIDHFGARQFLVWTQMSWFVFQLTNNGTEKELHDHSDEISIQLIYQVDLLEHFAHLAESSLLEVTISQVSAGRDLVQCTLTDTLNNLIKVTAFEAIYGESDNEQGPSGLQTLKCWQEQPEAHVLALSSTGKQLFNIDAAGDLYLRRQRQKSWSKPKLIRSAGSSKEARQFDEEPFSADRTPLAIEVDDLNDVSNETDQDLGARFTEQLSEQELRQLAKFERGIDRMEAEDELEPSYVFETAMAPQEGSLGKTRGNNRTQSTGVRCIKLYWPSCVVVLQLGGKELIENQLVLPRDVRNVRIGPNKGQLSSVMVQLEGGLNEKHLLTIAAAEKLLVYSVERETLLRCIDAHGGRITKLLPIICYQSGEKSLSPSMVGSRRRNQLSVASSSLDRTVKIWNLLNIDKESHAIDKLASGQIESISLCAQRPVAACLSRGQLSLWDWRTMRIVALFKSSADLRLLNDNQQQQRRQQDIRPAAILKCKFSSNGRHLAAATSDTLFVLAIESLGRQSGGTGSGRLTPAAPESTDWAKLKLVAECFLPSAGLVINLQFIAQDSRILTMIKSFSREQVRISSGECKQLTETGASQTEVAENADENEENEEEDDEEFRLTYNLRVSCHNIAPESRLLYSISCQVPNCKNLDNATQQASTTLEKGEKMRGTKAGHQLERHLARRTRLVALTSDQQFLVVVGSGSAPDGQTMAMDRRRRRSSAMSRTPLVLNIYSTRDGSLVKIIDLRHLATIEQQDGVEQWAPRVAPRSARSSASKNKQLNGTRATNELQIKLQQTGERQRTAIVQQASKPGDFIVINSDQFNRIKTLKHRDRQTLVALVDDERGLSFIIDIATRHLVTQSNNWNGKLTTDGRFGLSRLFSAVSARGPTSSSALDLNSAGGLRLLEMRRCRPVKGLLSIEQLNSARRPLELQAATGGSGSGDSVLSGFTKPNDAYVYYCDPALRRLLLVRLRDSQLIANYKLSTQVTKIKCSSDGLALVLAQADGSLTSLAIVDAQTSDTMTRLAQYPSRRQLTNYN